MFLPARAPDALVRRLADLFDGATQSAVAREYYARVAGEAFVSPREGLKPLIERDTVAWRRLVKAAGI